MTEHKIVVVGGGGVGKSALTIQFTQNHFVEEFDPTIEDTYRKQIVIDEETIILDIVDTAGAEEYSSTLPSHVKGSKGFIIVYAINSRNSFDAVDFYHHQILQHKDVGDFPIMVVGNKNDLENEREVSQGEGMDEAQRIKGTFIETSAKENSNVEQLFFDLTRKIIFDYKNQNQNRNRSNLKRNRCNIF
ncbi:ras-like protein [Anaeramoeba flamelloides]|uniref:Ras-like protein n=1 Tax=Anaeramoeba flamelloides TaxID=1746091 RepID=A0AAV8A0H6_9EUKA|nr:ras-like protein [Anaeramoeba flamelloides]